MDNFEKPDLRLRSRLTIKKLTEQRQVDNCSSFKFGPAP